MVKQKQVYIAQQLEKDFDKSGLCCLTRFVGIAIFIHLLIILIKTLTENHITNFYAWIFWLIVIYLVAAIPYAIAYTCYISYHEWKNNTISSKNDIYQNAKEMFDKGRYKEVIKLIEETQIDKEEKLFKELLEASFHSIINIINEYKSKEMYFELEKIITEIKELNLSVEQQKLFDVITREVMEELQANKQKSVENSSQEKQKRNEIDDIYFRAQKKFNKGKYNECINLLNKAQINKSETRFEELLNACYKELDELIYNKAWELFYKQEYSEVILILQEKSKSNIKFKELLDTATKSLIELNYSKALEYKKEKKYIESQKLIKETKKFNLSLEQQKLFDNIMQEIEFALENEPQNPYNKAIEYLDKHDYNNALKFANIAFRIENSSINSKLIKHITNEANEYSIYNDILKYYNSKKVIEAQKAIDSNINRIKCNKIKKLFNNLAQEINIAIENEFKQFRNTAIEYFVNKDYDNALKFTQYAKRIQIDNTIKEILTKLGDIYYQEAKSYFQLNNYDLAEKSIKKAIEANNCQDYLDLSKQIQKILSQKPVIKLGRKVDIQTKEIQTKEMQNSPKIEVIQEDDSVKEMKPISIKSPTIPISPKTNKEIGAEYYRYALQYETNNKKKQALEYITTALKYDPSNSDYLQMQERLSENSNINKWGRKVDF